MILCFRWMGGGGGGGAILLNASLINFRRLSCRSIFVSEYLLNDSFCVFGCVFVKLNIIPDKFLRIFLLCFFFELSGFCCISCLLAYYFMTFQIIICKIKFLCI